MTAVALDPAELSALVAEAERRGLVPPDYGGWLARARPSMRWDARHFRHMQAVLNRVTSGELRRVLFQVAVRHGKALALDTPIPTPDGWKIMGDLRVGDVVFDDRGDPCNITWLSPTFPDRHVFRVRTDDGDEVVADEAHEWSCAITPRCRRGRGRRIAGRAISIRETRWLAERELRPYVEPHGGLQLPEADLPLDPYMLGAWLGDGHLQGGQFTCSVADLLHFRAQVEAAGFVMSEMPSMATGRTATSTIRAADGCKERSLNRKLRRLGLIRNRAQDWNGYKHIPSAYLRASHGQRLALLQGLIDTDGYVAKDGQVEFCTTDRPLADGVQELVRSLGRKCSLHHGRATIYGRDCGPKYRVMFYMAGAARLPRKADRCRDSVKRPGRYLSFEYVGRADTMCIEVNSPSHLFLCGRGMTPTRNTENNTIGYASYRIEREPSTRFLVGTYSQLQSHKISRAVRRLVRDRGVRLSPDRDAVSEWETVAGGGVRAVGSGSGVASVNADVIIIDDPIGSRAEAESPAHREAVWDWITSDILARCEPHTAVLFSMPRWHEDDPAGRLRDRQGAHWHVVDLPGRAEAHDPLGRAEGELLWPEERGAQWHEEQRIFLGEYGYASLVQGRPRPRDGGMFKWEWWRLVEAVPATGPMIRYWDLAGTQPKGRNHDPDYTAGALLCRMPDQRTAIVDVARFRLSVAARDAEIERLCRDDLARYPGRVKWWIETEAGIAGTDRTTELVRRLQALGMVVQTEHPTGNKTLRAEPLANKAEMGNLVLCPGPWRDEFRTEAAMFPQGAHDDQIDAAAGADAKLAVRHSSTTTTFRI